MVGILVKEGTCAAVVARHALLNDNARHADRPLSTSATMAEVLSGTLARRGGRGGDAAGVGGGSSHGNRQLGLANTSGMECITAALVCADLVVRFACRTRRPFRAALDLWNSVTATARSSEALRRTLRRRQNAQASATRLRTRSGVGMAPVELIVSGLHYAGRWLQCGRGRVQRWRHG